MANNEKTNRGVNTNKNQIDLQQQDILLKDQLELSSGESCQNLNLININDSSVIKTDLPQYSNINTITSANVNNNRKYWNDNKECYKMRARCEPGNTSPTRIEFELINKSESDGCNYPMINPIKSNHIENSISNNPNTKDFSNPNCRCQYNANNYNQNVYSPKIPSYNPNMCPYSNLNSNINANNNNNANNNISNNINNVNERPMNSNCHNAKKGKQQGNIPFVSAAHPQMNLLNKFQSRGRQTMRNKTTVQCETYEKMEIYYFDHGNAAYFRTTDAPPTLSTDVCSDQTLLNATKFWAEVFGTLHVGLIFFIVFFLQLYRFILYTIIRSILIGFIQLTGDYFLKPFLIVVFNSLLQPPIIFIYNIMSSLSDMLEPVSKTLQYIFRPIGELLTTIRLFEIVQHHHQYQKPILTHDVDQTTSYMDTKCQNDPV